MEAGLTATFVEDWGRRWLEVWNAHDVDGIVSMCTEDVSWHDPALPEWVHGREEVRRFAAATFRAFPDVRIEELEPPYLATTSPKALSPYRFVGTMSGPWEYADIAATGASVDFRGVDEWEFRGELLCRYDTHYDGMDVARQMGLVPAVGSQADRVLTRLQHLQARFQRRAKAGSAR
jgi:predicted ester cyclase